LVQIVIEDPTHFKVVLSNFNAQFTNFDLSLHGGTSWLYNIFLKNFKDSIEKAAQNALNTQVSTAVNTVINNALQTLDLQVPIGTYGVMFDSTLQSVQNTPSLVMTVGTAGRLFAKGYPDYSGSPSAMPYTIGSDKMMEVFVSDYTLNTAGFAFNQVGMFNFLVTKDLLPSVISWVFNTTNLQFFIPQLYSKYPNCGLQIDMTVANPPTVTIAQNVGAEMSVIGEAIFQVIQPNNKTVVNAFGLDLNVLLDVEAGIVGNNITATLSFKSANVTVGFSTIGSLDVSLLSSLVTFLFQYGIVPIGNMFAKQGIPIPAVDGLTLQNPVVVYQNGYFAVRSDFTFVPPNNL